MNNRGLISIERKILDRFRSATVEILIAINKRDRVAAGWAYGEARAMSDLIRSDAELLDATEASDFRNFNDAVKMLLQYR